MNAHFRTTYWKLKFRHSLLKLQVHKPIHYHAALSVTVILAAAAMASGIFLLTPDRSPTQAGKVGLAISTYSLNGEVTSFYGTTVSIKSAFLSETDGVTEVAYRQKEVAILPTTTVFKVRTSDQGRSTATASDISAGATLAIYSSADPENLEAVPAERIEIIVP
jgi:hypothetical protein